MNETQMRKLNRNQPKLTNCKSPHLWTLLNSSPAAQIDDCMDELSPIIGNIAIIFAEAGEMSRKVIRRSNYKMTHKFPSAKNSSMVHCESRYEMYACQLLEILSLVIAYRAQPAIFKYSSYAGLEHSHFPDIFIELKNGVKAFIEVKPERSRQEPMLLDRTTLIKRLLKPMGYQYILVFSEQLLNLSYLDNARHLLRYAATHMLLPSIETVRNTVKAEQNISLISLIKNLANTEARGWIYRMIIDGQLDCDLSSPLTNDTLINWHF